MPSGLLFYSLCLWLCSVILFFRSILLWVAVSQGMSIKFTDPWLLSILADSFCCRSHTGHLLALCAAVICTDTLCSLSSSSQHPRLSPFSAEGCPAGWLTPCVSVCFRTFSTIPYSVEHLLRQGAVRNALAVGISPTSSVVGTVQRFSGLWLYPRPGACFMPLPWRGLLSSLSASDVLQHLCTIGVWCKALFMFFF